MKKKKEKSCPFFDLSKRAVPIIIIIIDALLLLLSCCVTLLLLSCIPLSIPLLIYVYTYYSVFIFMACDCRNERIILFSIHGLESASFPITRLFTSLFIYFGFFSPVLYASRSMNHFYTRRRRRRK